MPEHTGKQNKISDEQRRRNRTPEGAKHWQTWTEFVDAAEEASRKPEVTGKIMAECETTMTEALKLARTGYTGALPEVDRFIARVIAKVRAPKDPDWDYDVAGAEVDIGRAVAGEPEDMIADAPHRETRTGRAVRLVIPVSSCFFQSEDRVRTRGVAVMALVDALRRAKHTLEIWAVDARHSVTNGGNESRRVQSILLKPANAPLDEGRVMFALMHPGMPRRLCLATMHPRLSCKNAFCPAPYDARVSDLPDDRGRGQTVVITADGGYAQGAGRWDAGEEGAIEWVQRQIDVITGETGATPTTTRNFSNA